MAVSKLVLATIASLAAGLPAQASPMAFGGAVAPAAGAPGIEHVQWRGRGWGRGGGFGWGWGALGAGIVAGAIIADQAYRPRRGYYYDTYAYDGPYYYPADYHGDPRVICARNFRSFEWRTGYYTTYAGEHRVCPYLR